MDLRRTDLAMEARELWQERAGQTAQLPGVRAEERKRAGMPVTVVQVLDERGEQALGKPRGTYVTLTLEGVETRADGAFPRAVEAVAAELGELLEQIDLKKGPVLVAGLGNRAITPDAVGPGAADHTMVTRHLVEQVPEHFGAFRPVAALAAGDLAGVARRMYNVFEDVLPERRGAEVQRIKNALVQQGALGASMSGTGSTVFGLFDREEAARRAYELLQESYRDTFLARSLEKMV